MTKLRNIGLSLLSALVLSVLGSTLQSCGGNGDDEDELGNWIAAAPYGGSSRSGAFSFVINDVLYAGSGYGNDKDYFQDVWSFDLSSGGVWSEAGVFPGVGRERAVSFSINGKGYVGMGFNSDLNTEELADFWEFNPIDKSWRRLNDFPRGARYNSVSFSINGKGYLIGGYDGTDVRGDFYEYDPTTDKWTQIANNPGEKKEAASTFTINGKVYFFGGRTSSSTYSNDFWEFDPEGRTWTRKTPDDDEDYWDEFQAAVRRHDAVTFTVNGYGYVATGVSNSSYLTSVYEYTPASGEWIKKTPYENSQRGQAVSFVIGDRAFVGTGSTGSRRVDGLMEFRPFDEQVDDD